MSSSMPAILPPNSLGEAVRPIGLLSESEFSKILELVSGPRGFSPTKEQFEEIERSIPKLAVNLGFVLAALSFLTGQAEHFEEAGQPFDSIFSSVVDELDKGANWGEAKGIAANRLKEIFDKRDAYKRFKKLNRLRTGFLPNATGFSTFVDIRPNFEGKPKQVVDLIATVQMRLTTDATAVAQRELVFQISEEALKLLKEAVSSIEEKIQILKSSNYLEPKKPT